MSPAGLRNPPCIAVIADMVRSRDLPAGMRSSVQERFTEFIADLNETYSDALISRFIITLGDEFQGLINKADVIPNLIWDIGERFPERDLRVGFGIGTIQTKVPEFAINVDGPALHLARSAVNTAKRQRALGGYFSGFQELDAVFNGISRILWWHRSTLTKRQLNTLELLRKRRTQMDIAMELGVTKQMVSKRTVAAGLSAYVEAEDSLRILLRTYVNPLIRG